MNKNLETIQGVLDTTKEIADKVDAIICNRKPVAKTMTMLIDTIGELTNIVDTYWDYQIYDEADEDIRLLYEEYLESLDKIKEISRKLLNYIATNNVHTNNNIVDNLKDTVA